MAPFWRRPLPPRSAGIVLGVAALAFLAIQLATGALLAMYYQPSWDGAHASVVRIAKDVPRGWLVRGVHVWSAHLLTLVLLLHLLRAFARGAHEPPRRATWIAGAVLLVLVLAGAMTGEALPLDEVGLSGLQVAAGFADSAGLGRLARGGDEVGGATLGRAFAAHVVLIPFAIAFAAAWHLVLVNRRGLKGAEALEGEDSTFRRLAVPAALGALGLAVGLAAAFPVGIGPAPDPLASSGNVKPMWMFLPIYQALKHVPSWAGNLLPAIPVAYLFALPWIRPKALAAGIGIALLVALVALGVLGARS